MATVLRTLRNKFGSRSSRRPESQASPSHASDAGGGPQRTSTHIDAPLTQAVVSDESDTGGAFQQTSHLSTPAGSLSATVLPSPNIHPSSHTPSADTSLPSTVREITADCPQFRILVMGKTGCGKSSLINKVFGVDVANVSHTIAGEADINIGFCPPDNDHLILHDSRGFEPGEKENLATVKSFIEGRSQMSLLKDRLHAIWICISVPDAGDRVTERGVEEIFKMMRKGVPIIVVFTKYDKLVTTKIIEGNIDTLSDEDAWRLGETKAEDAFQGLCVHPLTVAVGEVRVMKVSTQQRYKETIAKLVEATDDEVQRHMSAISHNNPASLAWAVAQRGSSGLNIEASVDVGRRRYWKGLLSSTDFTGQKLRSCLDVIHYDIVSVWNINSKYLGGQEFKAKMLVLVNDLVENPNIPVPGDSLTVATVAALATAAASNPLGIVITSVGAVVIIARWILDVYQNTTRNIACVMGYIVDLTIVMHRFPATDVSEERIVSVLQHYVQSGEIMQVHNDIRKYVNNIPTLRLGDTDHTLKEIERLIDTHCNDNSAGMVSAA